MSGLSILVAEDESLIRLDIVEMLEQAGHDICAEVGNGVKAVEMAKKMHPDLAILDIKMPGLDGIEVAKILHEMNIPVILLTAYTEQNIIRRAEKVSVYGYLTKPISEKDILPTIQIAYSRWKEMQNVRAELKETKKKLDGQSQLNHAKSILAGKHDLNELEAHKMLLHKAMENRISNIEMAKKIIAEDKSQKKSKQKDEQK